MEKSVFASGVEWQHSIDGFKDSCFAGYVARATDRLLLIGYGMRRGQDIRRKEVIRDAQVWNLWRRGAKTALHHRRRQMRSLWKESGIGREGRKRKESIILRSGQSSRQSGFWLHPVTQELEDAEAVPDNSNCGRMNRAMPPVHTTNRP